MPSLIAPRYELSLIDNDGRMSREWYKFFVLMAKSIGPSLTSTDDLQNIQTMDVAAVEAIALRAAAQAAANTHLLFEPTDQPKPVDSTLLALWPGDSK